MNSAIVVYFIFAVLFSFLKTIPPKQNCTATNEIFITSNGVHLDIILPVENVNPRFLEKLDILPGTKFVSFGWGDKEFYINTPEWSDLTFTTAFKVLFVKSKTAMHVICYENSYQSWKHLNLCDVQIDSLNRFIENSFKKTENGNVVKLDVKGYYNYDSFFAAKGSFSIFQTCNVWVNNALKEIGVKTSIWSPFDFGVLHHVPD